jgi:hypothetical protein
VSAQSYPTLVFIGISRLHLLPQLHPGKTIASSHNNLRTHDDGVLVYYVLPDMQDIPLPQNISQIHEEFICVIGIGGTKASHSHIKCVLTTGDSDVRLRECAT